MEKLIFAQINDLTSLTLVGRTLVVLFMSCLTKCWGGFQLPFYIFFLISKAQHLMTLSYLPVTTWRLYDSSHRQTLWHSCNMYWSTKKRYH